METKGRGREKRNKQQNKGRRALLSGLLNVEACDKQPPSASGQELISLIIFTQTHRVISNVLLAPQLKPVARRDLNTDPLPTGSKRLHVAPVP